MQEIKLLDRTIKLYTKNVPNKEDKQAEFARLSHIKESTLKTWRRKGVIPADKILLLNTLIENHELKEEKEQFKQYFLLQTELSKKFQN
jgi:hypothetical protein